jgi:hypothetical protein
MLSGPAGGASGVVRRDGVDWRLFSSGPSVDYKQPKGSCACVADLQITDRTKVDDELIPVNPAPGRPPPAGVYQTRVGASVYQKKFNEKEATLLVQQRLSAALAGYL